MDPLRWIDIHDVRSVQHELQVVGAPEDAAIARWVADAVDGADEVDSCGGGGLAKPWL